MNSLLGKLYIKSQRFNVLNAKEIELKSVLDLHTMDCVKDIVEVDFIDLQMQDYHKNEEIEMLKCDIKTVETRIANSMKKRLTYKPLTFDTPMLPAALRENCDEMLNNASLDSTESTSSSMESWGTNETVESTEESKILRQNIDLSLDDFLFDIPM